MGTMLGGVFTAPGWGLVGTRVALALTNYRENYSVFLPHVLPAPPSTAYAVHLPAGFLFLASVLCAAALFSTRSTAHLYSLPNQPTLLLPGAVWDVVA
jgi:hypothetical protein